MTTRAEHMAWCKKRAIQELDAGSPQNGFASMCSDLGKHPDTADHPAIRIGTILLLIGMLSSDQQVRNFIEGFN